MLGRLPGPKSLYVKLLHTRSSDRSGKTDGETARTDSEGIKSKGVARDIERGRQEDWDELTLRGSGNGSADREMALREVV